MTGERTLPGAHGLLGCKSTGRKQVPLDVQSFPMFLCLLFHLKTTQYVVKLFYLTLSRLGCTLLSLAANMGGNSSHSSTQVIFLYNGTKENSLLYLQILLCLSNQTASKIRHISWPRPRKRVWVLSAEVQFCEHMCCAHITSAGNFHFIFPYQREICTEDMCTNVRWLVIDMNIGLM